MKFRRTGGESINEDENPYWVSFSDIMAGLLVVFILFSMALMLEIIDKKEQIDTEITEPDRVRQELVLEIKEELKKKGINIEVTDNKSVIRIPEDQLSFAPAKWDISAQYKEAAQIIGKVVYDSIDKQTIINTSGSGNNPITIRRKDILDTVFIEGHTDTVPYRSFLGFEDGNWPLSSLRAISLWEYWNKHNNYKFEKLENNDGRKLFSVSGYGGTRPLSAIHSKNRRIDLRFTVRTPDLSSI